MIYIIYGASGTGKTTLLNCVYNMYGQYSIHRKGTTRPKRQYDDIEIESFPEGLPKGRFGNGKGYVYTNYGFEYGIEKAQIDIALTKEVPHFIICNDIEKIREIKRDYPNLVRVIYFHFDAPRESILEIQKRRNISDDEIELRLSKIDFLTEQFAHNMDLFDTSLLNHYGSNPEVALQKDVESLIMRFENESTRKIPDRELVLDLVDVLVERIREWGPEKAGSVNTIVEKGYIFTIMPIPSQGRLEEDRQRNKSIWETFSAIRNASANCGFRAARVDRISGDSTIDRKIIDNIKKAELIVADLSFERPNCYYELGYARAIGKKIITIASKNTKVHFDVEHYDCLFFSSGEELESDLQKRLNDYKNGIGL